MFLKLKMRKFTRKFILSLPGPPSSYCTCNKLCSPIEIDHVVPQKYLKENITDRKKLNDALNDPYNIYRCCANKNRKKGHTILTNDIAGDEFSGLMSRSYLYMKWRYKMKISKNLLSTIKCMDRLHSPFTYEKKRSDKIKEYNDQINPFVYLGETKDKY